MSKSSGSLTLKKIVILFCYFSKGLFYYSRIIALKVVDRITIKITKPPIIKSIDETIDYIYKNRSSVSRYGDGEFDIMMGFNILFQKYSRLLAVRLKRIIKSNYSNHIVCLPDVFQDLNQYEYYAKMFWRSKMALFRLRWYYMINKKKIYYDTHVTRIYFHYQNREKSEQRFRAIKKIWNKKNIVFVEGSQSRLGLGNDLFKNAISIERIIAPPENAFEKYDQILNEVLKIDKSKLILIALGPTATVLAYDLARAGYQAIDIGHIDIEYEWYLMKATDKVPIKYKYVNEAKNGKYVNRTNDPKYLNQILVKIK